MLPAASALMAALATGMCFFSAPPAQAFSIELRGAAPMRIERQRQYALRPAEQRNIEPATDAIRERLIRIGAHEGSPVFIRVFKAESELEVWVRGRARFVLFKRYRICFWSGTLGPKLNEGDGQTPEGFYTITRRRLHWSRRWARSLDIGYPNAFDRRHRRTGSHILIHGGCSSIGCFSMTNSVMSEVHHLVKSAIKRGQSHVHVHAFPFRMTEANLQRHRDAPWIAYWRDLQTGYHAFERTRLPPRIGICGKRYVVRPASHLVAGDPGGVRVLDLPPRRYAAHGPIDIKPEAEWRCQHDSGRIARGGEPAQPFIAGGGAMRSNPPRRRRYWRW